MRTRVGRKAQETHREFLRNVGDFASAMANAEWKYDSTVTKSMIIERTEKATGKTEVITFSQAYGELSMWLDRSFANTSEYGFSDALCEMFFAGSQIHTGKAIYRLWQKPVPKDEMICLNDRKDEFRAALHRAETNDLETYPDFEKDCFVVVNNDSGSEYRVELKSAGGQVFGKCECPDFENRRRVCKHLSTVLADTFFGALYKNYPEPDIVTAYCGCLCDRAGKKTISYCYRHEAEYEYRYAIWVDGERGNDYERVMFCGGKENGFQH